MSAPSDRALVHALLASMDLKADAPAVDAAASVHGRIVGATVGEISAVIATIGRVLAHPILRRAAKIYDSSEWPRRTSPTKALGGELSLNLSRF